MYTLGNSKDVLQKLQTRPKNIIKQPECHIENFPKKWMLSTLKVKTSPRRPSHRKHNTFFRFTFSRISFPRYTLPRFTFHRFTLPRFTFPRFIFLRFTYSRITIPCIPRTIPCISISLFYISLDHISP
jgi:hypothetical protein